MKRRRLLVVILIIFIYIGYGFYNGLKTTYFTYTSGTLPQEFDGYRIAFISDFHCKMIGENEEKLIQAIDNCKPDIIVFTGDMVDDRHKDITAVQDLLSGLAGKYPMYAISGNHEKDIPANYTKLLEYYNRYGVSFIDNDSKIIKKGNAQIGIYGKSFVGGYYTTEFLKGPDTSKSDFNILLYHDATAFPAISSLGYDLVLSGHTHGGVIRFPLIGGLLTNEGTLFSTYDNGVYRMLNSTLISSRGIGDTSIPRFYNRSELICVTLNSTK